MHRPTIYWLPFIAVVIAMLLWAVLSDAGSYRHAIETEGLSGVLGRPRLVMAQFMVVMVEAILVRKGLRKATRMNRGNALRCFRIAAWTGSSGLLAYLLALYGISTATYAVGGAGILAIFVLCPAVMMMAVCVVVTVTGFVALIP
jgi:hypothetical protein